jgi:A/G-specific adenine glycosylase
MSDIAQYLLPWFDQYGRKDLPWQQQVNGYRVWLSEIMLQQTQVTTVIPYFNRFIESFPDVVALANAELDSILQHWAGLGYYARARNLHKTACIVRDQFNGNFPQDQQQLEALPGIGRSTAGAILSLAYSQKAAILDGNVKRVLARVYQVDGWYGQSATLKKLWTIAEQQTPDHRAAHYNQSMMDLGATVCKRSKPLCESCPLTKICASFQQGTQQQYPVSRPLRNRPHKHRWVLLHQSESHILLERRPPSGIWGGLWSLPEMEDLAQLDSWQLQYLGQVRKVSETQENSLLHKFTHFDLSLSVARVELPRQSLGFTPQMVAESERYQWIEREQLDRYGLPTPIQKILNRY